ncbi:hypothetical protein [Pedobacter alpinus]|uniref:Outer membrane protein beta-barrel domain-containing protein n=1 Tax=Pedobacter alpinus TaxID=1590643 RepID=A0ABW5TNS6_9SPHI
MKKLLPIIFFQLFAIACLAQSQSDSQYSIGFKLLAIEEQPKLLNEVRANSKFYTTGLNGLMLKINDNQISYRFLISTFKEDDYSFKNECLDCEIVNGEYKSLDLKMGFERSLIYSKFQPFYGADLGYKRTTFIGVSNDNNSGTFNYDTNIEKNGASLTPFIGVKYNFVRSLTLSAEAGFDFIYTTDKEIKTTNANTNISVNNFTRWQYNSRPLAQLSLQFNFGRD